MKRMFLEKFFPASKIATIRKEICEIWQHFGETLRKYWERFNNLCAMCPHHQISEQLLLQYFSECLLMMDKNMVDMASGGVISGGESDTVSTKGRLGRNRVGLTRFRMDATELD
ncbi:hypothetical protein CR513_15695, partial [Mucuna pruriens]